MGWGWGVGLGLGRLGPWAGEAGRGAPAFDFRDSDPSVVFIGGADPPAHSVAYATLVPFSLGLERLKALQL